ncbi:hypothetical protein ACVWYH_008625 [Bradyrhizobium sp. GM24.11]
MRMVPPLRGVWASAGAASASPKPATIAIILNIMCPLNAGIPIRDLIIHSPSNASFVLMVDDSGSAPLVSGCTRPAQQAAD